MAGGRERDALRLARALRTEKSMVKLEKEINRELEEVCVWFDWVAVRVWC
eukprot:COSAG01_NODE_39175_length_480_cov_0.674541_2_plen_49_part_01